MRFLIHVAIMLLLTGCIPYSDNPLSDQSKEALDDSIIGTWFWNEQDDYGFVHIGKDTDDKTLLITMIEFKNAGRIDTTEFKGHTSRLASHRFLNLKWTKPQDWNKGYIFIKYEVIADTLVFSSPDLSVLEKAVRSGALRGEIASSGDVLIHAGQNELRSYIVVNDKALFANSSTLTRLTLPKPQGQVGSSAKPVDP